MFLDSWVTRSTLTAGPISISYLVTVGPRLKPVTWASTSNCLGTVRVDHDFGDRDRAYVVYNEQSQNSASVAVVSPFTGLGLTQNDNRNHTLSLSEVHLFGGSIVNEVRGGFNRVPTLKHSNQTLRQFLQNIGMTSADIAA